MIFCGKHGLPQSGAFWLKFNERVLEEAEREDVPLCERLSFVSIFQSNLDEFFMVRVGSLIDQMSVDETYRENKTHMTPAQQLEAIFTQARELNRRKDEVYQQLMDRLEGEGVRLVNFRKITQEESAHPGAVLRFAHRAPARR